MLAEVASLEEIPEEDESRRSSITRDSNSSPLTSTRYPVFKNGRAGRPRTTNFSRPRPFSPTSDISSSSNSPTLDRTSIDAQFRPHLHVLQASGKTSQRRARNVSSDSDSDDAAPPPVIRTHADQGDLDQYFKRAEAPSNWSDRLYADSVIDARDSDIDSVTTTGTDIFSIASSDDSVAQALSTDMSEITFDGRLGWTHQPPSQREDDRQRWAPPRTNSAPDVRPLDLRKKEARSKPRAQDSWYIDSGDETPFDDVDRLDDYVQAVRAAPAIPAKSKRRSHHEDSPVGSRPSSRPGGLSQSASEKSTATIRPQLKTRQSDPRYHAPAGATAARHFYPPADTAPLKSQQHDLTRHSSSSTGRSGRSNTSSSSNQQPLPLAHINGYFGPEAPNATNSHASAIGRANSRASTNTKSSIDSAEWRASNFDVSSLSEAKLAKLRKKGIDPALYLEMKHAKTGNGKRGGLGILTGNSFLG